MPDSIDYTSLLGHYSATTRSYSVGARIGARHTLAITPAFGLIVVVIPAKLGPVGRCFATRD